ncbi:hypothetical protein APHAL10511_000619 [Amanita phalloides]|nr:hypothetical protein APHAL10511_000619 [Amanita phalloides]
MVLKLYGIFYSTCTQRAATVLHEKKIPFELIPIDLAKGEQKAQDFLEKQPFGQIPVLDDNGFIIHESRAISLYLAYKYADQGTPLVSPDPMAKALHAQAQSIEAFNFDPYASGIVSEKIIKPRKGLQTDEALVIKYASILDAKLDGYERILSKQKYLSGNELTLADLFHLPYGTKLYDAGYGHLIDKRANVKRWFDELRNRDSWLAVKDGVKGTA